MKEEPNRWPRAFVWGIDGRTPFTVTVDGKVVTVCVDREAAAAAFRLLAQ